MPAVAKADGRTPQGWDTSPPQPADARVFDIPTAGPLPSIAMSVIAQATAYRQSDIDRPLAEIKAVTDVAQILGASALASSLHSPGALSSSRKVAGADSRSRIRTARMGARRGTLPA